MVTPVEVHVGNKALDWIKRGATFLFKLGKRIATLEERVTALEQQLRKAPGGACPYCGEHAMRLSKKPSIVRGNHPKRWTEETWTCGVCEKNYTKRIPV
jgi:uncharacterized protein with PIN domain